MRTPQAMRTMMLSGLLFVSMSALPWVASNAYAQGQFVEEEDTFGEPAAPPADDEPEPVPAPKDPPADPPPADEPSADEGDKAPADDEPDAPADEPDDDDKPARASDKPKTNGKSSKSNGDKPADKGNDKNDKAADKSTDPKDAAKANGEVAKGIVIRKLSFDGVLERWDAFRRADQAKEIAKAKRFESILNDGLRDFGIQGLQLRPQLVALAKARTSEAEQAFADDDLERALLAAEQSTKLAPDKPQTHLLFGRLKLASGDSAGAIQAFGDALQAAKRDPTSNVYGAFYGLLVLMVGMLLFLTILSAFFLLRAYRYLAFDLHSFLPRGAAKWQVYALLLIALALPVTLRLGPVFIGVVWMTVVFIYLTRREQVLVLLLSPLMVASPFAVEAIGVLGAYQGSRVEQAYRALQDAGAVDVRAKLKERPPASLLQAELMALGFEAKREGRLEEARDHWRKVVQRFSDVPAGHINLGVASALLGAEEFALSSFNKASGMCPTCTEGSYNASLVHTRNKEPAKAAKLTEPLQASAPDLLEAYRSATFHGGTSDIPHNRAFVDGAYPVRVLEDLFANPPQAAVHIDTQLRAVLFLGLDAVPATIAIGVFVLLWVALLGVRKKFVPSAPCKRCGTPASSRYDAESCPEGMCTGCHNIFDSTGVRIEASRRIAKEYQAKSFRSRRRTAGLLLSVLWPGLGLLWVRASLRGALLGLLYFPACVLVGFGLGYILWPDITPDVASTMSLWAGGGLAVLLQLIGLRMVLSETE